MPFIAILTETRVAGVVFTFGGGRLLALVLAKGAGCAAAMGAAIFGNLPLKIQKTAGAGSAA